MKLYTVAIASLAFYFSIHSLEQLIAAVESNNTQAALSLLKSGINPNSSKNKHGHPYGQELITIAAQNSNRELVQALLDAGANAHGIFGEPLRNAAERGEPDLVDFLLAHGAKLESAQEGLALGRCKRRLSLEQCAQVQDVIKKHENEKA